MRRRALERRQAVLGRDRHAVLQRAAAVRGDRRRRSRAAAPEDRRRHRHSHNASHTDANVERGDNTRRRLRGERGAARRDRLDDRALLVLAQHPWRPDLRGVEVDGARPLERSVASSAPRTSAPRVTVPWLAISAAVLPSSASSTDVASSSVPNVA